LRFTSFAVINLRRDLHPQECAHAGRTIKKTANKTVDGFSRLKLFFEAVVAARPSRILELSLFDFFQHFEHTFWSIDEQAFESLAQTTALEGVTACTFCF